MNILRGHVRGLAMVEAPSRFAFPHDVKTSLAMAGESQLKYVGTSYCHPLLLMIRVCRKIQAKL
jgi:hypothetical protein